MSTNVEISSKVSVGASHPLLIICGPCVVESRDHTMRAAETIVDICRELQLPLVFKSSFDKANRTSSSSFRGPGMSEGLEILAEVRQSFEVPVITDIHSAAQAAEVAETVDILQIPAFLCRQTDLLVAAAKTGSPVMIKKGQFVHPLDMAHAVEKIRSAGNDKVLLCERGSVFGYRELIVDYRGLQMMRELDCPIVFDATHSVQVMGGQGARSGGNRAFVPALARAAVAVGVDAVFLEAHENPDAAPSDGPNMIPFAKLKSLLEDLKSLSELKLNRDAE